MIDMKDLENCIWAVMVIHLPCVYATVKVRVFVLKLGVYVFAAVLWKPADLCDTKSMLTCYVRRGVNTHMFACAFDPSCNL